MATWYVVLIVCSSCVPLNSNTNTSSHSTRRTEGPQAPASGACTIVLCGPGCPWTMGSSWNGSRLHRDSGKARVCAVTIAVQHLLCSGDRGGTTTFQRRRHHSRKPGISRRRKWGRTGRDTAGSGAEGSMGNAVCQRCWDRVQIASRASDNNDGYRGGIRCVWLDRIGEEDGGSPDAAPEKAQQPGEAPTPPLPALEIAAAGQKYRQVHQLVYLGGLITEDADITRDINRRTKIAWGCFRKFSTELFDRPSAPLRLKARLLKAEAMEALLYGCMTWAPRNAHYRQLRTTHHKLLLRVIGYRRVHGTYRKMSYA